MMCEGMSYEQRRITKKNVTRKVVAVRELSKDQVKRREKWNTRERETPQEPCEMLPYRRRGRHSNRCWRR